MTTLARLETLAEADHFNQEVFRRVERFIGRRTLEVGTGIGIFTHRLLARCDLVVGVDVVPEFVARCATRFASAANLELHHAAMGCGVPPPLAGRSFDTIVCMNVLEHIEDDQRTLADLFTLLEPGGRLVLVVPQYPWLYNALDANDGHYRRYRRPGLAARLGTAGFALEHTSRFNLAGIAGWFINGTLLRRRELPNEQMRLYDRLVPWLFRLERLVGPPAGLSLLMVARRPPA